MKPRYITLEFLEKDIDTQLDTSRKLLGAATTLDELLKSDVDEAKLKDELTKVRGTIVKCVESMIDNADETTAAANAVIRTATG